MKSLIRRYTQMTEVNGNIERIYRVDGLAVEIYEAVWGMRPFGADNTIAVHIRHIREKIEEDPAEPHYLKVAWGKGYLVG